MCIRDRYDPTYLFIDAEDLHSAKGFTMNDELLQQAGGGNYFEELLARIRNIRSSEKVFWRKVLDIYATSIDSVSYTHLDVYKRQV